MSFVGVSYKIGIMGLRFLVQNPDKEGLVHKKTSPLSRTILA